MRALIIESSQEHNSRPLNPHHCHSSRELKHSELSVVAAPAGDDWMAEMFLPSQRSIVEAPVSVLAPSRTWWLRLGQH